MTERFPKGDAEADRAGASDTNSPLLEVDGLETHFPITTRWLRREVGRIRAVDGVSFAIDRGEAFGLVGESGSGKTTAAHSILGLEEPTGGAVRFDGQLVDELTGWELQQFRRRAQLVVQNPDDAFNPRLPVGKSVAEPLALHGMDDEERRRAIVADLLERVGLEATDANRFPHEFSGGEKQRLSIARALVVNPDLIVADEPTSALDGRVKADVLSLLDELRREFDIAVLCISHDIDVVRRFCDRVGVMYLGELVERGETEAVLESPAHPYTRVLIGSIPSLDPSDRSLVRPLTETVPAPSDPPSGCRFHPRCQELIPPTASLEREDWRAIARFRFALQEGTVPEPIAVDSGTRVDPETVRDAFDLPTDLPNEGIEDAVEAATRAVADGDLERARERLAESLSTVCERTQPEAGDECEHLVRCHRYDSTIEAEPIPWRG
ncbi:ATP-binding cassette domain-containing protein [Natronococcus sp. A-GB1]|uniref:oligopeptide/dipeptide ABC transporter ATP-binding protein n=1 Tax=Natronococcus sp. A-GB1 TaxID=3037648 RepID=UPI00241DED1C|nr:oligopeptide/dipeptide ABC transporter ATP-binding protein [Natronococcus sp. A-GB1]MDG5759264.1 ATP-binding cassette domain-containing protein [Natronococcus sp. A-GB1]